MTRWSFRLITLLAVQTIIVAEDIFVVPVRGHDEEWSRKFSERLQVVAINNGEQDELIIAIRYGGFYEWSAELLVGPRVIPLTVQDLLYSGIRVQVGNAFTKAQASTLCLRVKGGMLK